MMALSLSAAATATDAPGAPSGLDPAELAFSEALYEPYGLTVSDPVRDDQITYSDLVDLLVTRLPADLEPPDLVVLAHAFPDARPREVVAARLNARTGGRAHSFSLSGEGLGAPFSALQLAVSYAAAGRAGRFLLGVVDQTTLPYEDPLVREHGLGDAGVLLAFGPGPGLSVTEAGRCPDGIEARLRDLVTEPGRTLIVTGAWADPGPAAATGADCHRAQPGWYCSGIWLALAGNLDRWSRTYETVLLHDTDPRSGTAYLAVLRTRP